MRYLLLPLFWVTIKGTYVCSWKVGKAMIAKAQALLKHYYGYNEFRSGQVKVISSLLAGRDALAIMPTGAGKSICFQIPALLLPGVTLVISPLISLMKDQVDALNNQGIPATYINSSLSGEETRQRLSELAGGRYKLVYVAPERLELNTFQTSLRELDISMIAIDEAHCVSQWGHDFRPSYRNIAPFIRKLAPRPIVGAFTATATPEVKTDIIASLSLAKPDVYVTGFDRPNLSFSVLRGENKQKFLLEYVKTNAKQSGIIYAATRKEVEQLHAFLRQKGYAAGRYHAGLDDSERTMMQEQFLYDDIRVMVATNAFGMGIDKSNVRYVIHYNMPRNMEAYYQEAGRSGRDGEPGECTLLFGQQDVMLQKFLIEKSVENPERKHHELRKLQDMVDYCHTPECLRQYILRYFGEAPDRESCGNCGNCNAGGEVTDVTNQSRPVFECVRQLRERFGITVVAEVLKGSNSQKIRQLGLSRVMSYGALSGLTLPEIKTLIQRLIATRYLQLTESEYPVVQLTAMGTSVLTNQAKVLQQVVAQRRIESDDALFETLRQLRKQVAQREKVPPYVVFADSTLREMCQHCPGDANALRQIKGVGDLKLAKYGAEFLECIHNYLQQSELAPAAASPGKLPSPQQDKLSHLVTLDMFRQGMQPAEIARLRGVSLHTLQSHLARCQREGHHVEWLE